MSRQQASPLRASPTPGGKGRRGRRQEGSPAGGGTGWAPPSYLHPGEQDPTGPSVGPLLPGTNGLLHRRGRDARRKGGSEEGRGGSEEGRGAHFWLGNGPVSGRPRGGSRDLHPVAGRGLGWVPSGWGLPAGSGLALSCPRTTAEQSAPARGSPGRRAWGEVLRRGDPQKAASPPPPAHLVFPSAEAGQDKGGEGGPCRGARPPVHKGRGLGRGQAQEEGGGKGRPRGLTPAEADPSRPQEVEKGREGGEAERTPRR